MSPAVKQVVEQTITELTEELEQLDREVRQALKAMDLEKAAALSLQMDMVGKRIDFARRALR